MQQNLHDEAKLHFNEPILMGFDLGRCIGYGETDEDCYLIIKDPRRGVYWHTFVGGYTYLDCLKQQGITIPLHPSYPGEIWTDFSRLDTLLELNGAPKEQEFLVDTSRCKLLDPPLITLENL
jgi:hypothetical protein